jgi:hypothetical protein
MQFFEYDFHKVLKKMDKNSTYVMQYNLNKNKTEITLSPVDRDEEKVILLQRERDLTEDQMDMGTLFRMFLYAYGRDITLKDGIMFINFNKSFESKMIKYVDNYRDGFNSLYDIQYYKTNNSS